MVDKIKTFNKTYLFVTMIYLFPLLIELLLYFLKGKFLFEIFSTIKSYMTFYATALTMTFTVYSFNKAQQRIEKDRVAEEKRDKEKRDRLKKKELEEKRDFYRPTFIVEKENNREVIKVLMRNNKLYLENVRFFESKSDSDSMIEKFDVSSGAVITTKEKIDSFYIIARTQIGENILFGRLNGKVKLYKYLREGGDALIPRLSYNQEEVDRNWGVYNADKITSNQFLDELFFYNTYGIREKIALTCYTGFEETLKAKSAGVFFDKIFKNIVDEYKNGSFTTHSMCSKSITL